MKKHLLTLLLLLVGMTATAQQRRPIDSRHPLWMIHVDVWNKADPQKIIDLVPDDIKPYVVMNLSMSCQWDEAQGVYKMPQDAVQTYKSWGSVCQHNRMWFMCQPASGGRSHLMDDELDTYEYFFKKYPNFLGWNFAEQFWGFDDSERNSVSQVTRIALFAKLVEMSHSYGGFVTISYCGNIWSHGLTPNGMLKRNKDLLEASKKYPEACLWLYKYTTTSCFYNSESVCLSPFISGLSTNYGVRYDNCGWNGAMEQIFGQNNGKKYPCSSGLSTVMEQSCVNGGAVWDGPELIWTEDFQNLSNTTVDGYERRNWGHFPNFVNGWIDMWRKIIDGTLYIPTREEVVGKTKIAVIADQGWNQEPSWDVSVNEERYTAWGAMYDNIYKQDDPCNRNNGQWHDNMTFFKKTGRYGAIPVCVGMYDDLSNAIELQVKKSKRNSVWPTEQAKKNDFDRLYPEVSTGDLYVNRFRNQLITYTPYTYLNVKTSATGEIPLKYNTCDKLTLTLGKLCNAAVREYADHIDFYMNNYRSDTLPNVLDKIILTGATSRPTYTMKKRAAATAEAEDEWDETTATYTLNVKHNGPVDISIKCAGAATDRATDILPSEPLTADLPKQPEPYYGPVTIEAEDMDYKSIASCMLDPYGQRPSVRGHSGNGFIETSTAKTSALRHNLKLDKAGDYNIVIKYCSTQKAGKLDVELNGETKSAETKLTDDNQWMKTSVTFTMKEGDNTLYIKNTAGIKMMIDNVTYEPVGTPVEKYTLTIEDVANGKVIPSTTTAAEGEIITLDIKPDEGYQFLGWEYHPRKHPYFKDNTMQMPNEDVKLKPLFESTAVLNAVYRLDFSGISEGTLPPGWQCTQENDEIHDYPNSYSLGARVFGVFGGYQGKALYWRYNMAEYGRQYEDYALTLAPGKYRLTYAMAAWKGTPQFRVAIKNLYSEEEIAGSDTFTATPNANGSKSADLSSAEERTLDFEITEDDDYVIVFEDKAWGELLLLECMVSRNDDNAINGITLDPADDTPVAIYGEDGRERKSLRSGINLVKMKSGKTRKLFIR